MLLVVAKVIIVAVAIYLLALGAIALYRPTTARGFLLGFADTAPKHYAELIARLLAGGSLLIIAGDSAYSVMLAVSGCILIVSTTLMALMPWRLHNRFARFAVPKALRFLPLIGVSSLILGGLLLWVIFAVSSA